MNDENLHKALAECELKRDNRK